MRVRTPQRATPSWRSVASRRRRGTAGRVSLSPAAMAQVTGVERIVLPSPNGSTICFALAETGARVLAASLRNASAVAATGAAGAATGASLAVIAAGERWPDDTLRPAIEDLWGAGAVIAALVDLGVAGLSPEARVAEQAFRAVRPDLAAELAACAGGVELAAAGFGDDVEVAARLDVSRVVPVLRGEEFAPCRWLPRAVVRVHRGPGGALLAGPGRRRPAQGLRLLGGW